MNTRKICVVTGSRAEYDLLQLLMKAIEQCETLELQIIATGMHLSPEFGLTFQQIEDDGFKIDSRVEMLLSSDTPVGISKSMGLGLIGFADAYEKLKPDMIVVLGDRFEIFAAAAAALVARIPIAHLYGGETTAGAFDEAFRHSITKMSHLHFVSTEIYRRRVIQLGEHPEQVFNVGGIAIDNIKKLKLLNREDTEKSIGFKLADRNLLVTFHPVTLEQATAYRQFSSLLRALAKLKRTHIIFTKCNADTDGRVINQMIDEYTAGNSDKSIAFTSLGQLKFLSLMQHVDGMVGNSSSGLIETPCFGAGTVNIGDRQQGRIRVASVIDCKPDEQSIDQALEKLFSLSFRKITKKVNNPYGDGNTVPKIIEIIKSYPLDGMVKKTFYDNP